MNDSIDEFFANRFKGFLPSLVTTYMNAEESERVKQLKIGLNYLDSVASDFENDISLFNKVQDSNINWACIACRDAAINIWSFKSTLKFIQQALAKCPNLQTAERTGALTVALNNFDKAFPDSVALRNAASHPIGLIAGKGRSNTANISAFTMHFSYSGSTVLSSYDGSELSFDITHDAWNNLKRIRDEVHETFR